MIRLLMKLSDTDLIYTGPSPYVATCGPTIFLLSVVQFVQSKMRMVQSEININ